jgi:hypothetical protein
MGTAKKILALKFTLLFLLLPALPPIAQAGEPTLESNVNLFLGEEGLLQTITIQGLTKKGSSIRAVPNQFDLDGTPTLLSRLAARPLDWRETKGTLSLFDRLCHRGRWKSVRSTSRPSMHIVVYRERDAGNQYHYWFLIHFDEYVPSGSNLWETAKHLTLEVIPNTFLGKAMSQDAVNSFLVKRYSKKID